jgi:hypothetical protein
LSSELDLKKKLSFLRDGRFLPEEIFRFPGAATFCLRNFFVSPGGKKSLPEQFFLLNSIKTSIILVLEVFFEFF